MPLNLCILETDELHPDLAPRFHSYGKMFCDLFANQPLAVNCEVYSVLNGVYPDPSKHYDGYVITGSKADAFSDEPWIVRLREFVLERYKEGAKLVGICFGHQLLAYTLGAHVGRSDKGWGLGVHEYSLTQHDWMQPQLNQLKLQVSHQDQVHSLPEGADLLAHSPFCANAAYSIGKQVLCFQGHPEFPEEYAQALLDLRRERLGEVAYHQASQSLKDNVHHGRIVGEWILRFIAS